MSNAGEAMTIDHRVETWQAFLQTHAVVLRKLESEMQTRHGLSLTWYEVLVQLKNIPAGCLRLQDLAQAIVLSQSGLTRLLDRMERAGLVERHPCSHDRRGAYAVITADGRTMLEQVRTTHIQGIERHFLQHLEAEEAQTLHQAFAKILAAEQ
jgi:DNA-binding MarR family transcriptional regulator